MSLILWMPPSVTEFTIVWLAQFCPANGVGAERPSAGVLPYRMVNRVAGSDDKITESSVVSVHTFADNMDDAEAAAQLTHRWMLSLGPPLVAQQPVTITTGTVMADCVETKQSPVWIDYEDNVLRRFVARYEIDLRFLTVA